MDRDRRYDPPPPDVWSASGVISDSTVHRISHFLANIYILIVLAVQMFVREKRLHVWVLWGCCTIITHLDERERKWTCETGRRTDRGRRGCSVNGTVSSVQVSLLRVLCPKALLSPYLLPLSSTADSVCLDCRSDAPSLLSLSPHLCHSCNSSVHHDCTLPCAANI